MIERKIIDSYVLKFRIEEFIRKELGDALIERVVFEKNPIAERITIYSSTPGSVIGRKGSNINKLMAKLQREFKFENPQIKVGEVESNCISARLVAKQITNNLTRFGPQKFRLTGFKTIEYLTNLGVMGCEIKISGKIPSSRARSWRFSKGYLKKTGYVSDFLIDKAIEHVTLKTGVIGIQVQIMLPKTQLPDRVEYIEDLGEKEQEQEDNGEETKEERQGQENEETQTKDLNTSTTTKVRKDEKK